MWKYINYLHTSRGTINWLGGRFCIGCGEEIGDLELVFSRIATEGEILLLHYISARACIDYCAMDWRTCFKAFYKNDNNDGAAEW